MRKNTIIIVLLAMFLAVVSCTPAPPAARDFEMKKELMAATPGTIIEFVDGNISVVRYYDGGDIYEHVVLMDIYSPGLPHTFTPSGVNVKLVANVYHKDNPKWGQMCEKYVLLTIGERP